MEARIGIDCAVGSAGGRLDRTASRGRIPDGSNCLRPGCRSSIQTLLFVAPVRGGRDRSSTTAIEEAQRRASGDRAGRRIRFIAGDLTEVSADGGPPSMCSSIASITWRAVALTFLRAEQALALRAFSVQRSDAGGRPFHHRYEDKFRNKSEPVGVAVFEPVVSTAQSIQARAALLVCHTIRHPHLSCPAQRGACS